MSWISRTRNVWIENYLQNVVLEPSRSRWLTWSSLAWFAFPWHLSIGRDTSVVGLYSQGSSCPRQYRGFPFYFWWIWIKVKCGLNCSDIPDEREYKLNITDFLPKSTSHEIWSNPILRHSRDPRTKYNKCWVYVRDWVLGPNSTNSFLKFPSTNSDLFFVSNLE